MSVTVTTEEVEFVNNQVEKYYGELGYKFVEISDGLLQGIRTIQGLTTGGGICKSDVELMVFMSKIFKPTAIYGVGNAFGLSTITLGVIHPDVPIDIIDAENEGKDNVKGTQITREISTKNNLNINLFSGYSPHDTYKALRSPTYDFVFIDGLHTNEQLFKDIISIYARLAKNCVLMLHDVGSHNLHDGIEMFRKVDPTFKFQFYNSIHYKNSIGTGFLYRGFDTKTFMDNSGVFMIRECEGFILDELNLNNGCFYQSYDAQARITLSEEGEKILHFKRSHKQQVVPFQWIGRKMIGKKRYTINFDIKFSNFVPRKSMDVGIKFKILPIIYNDWLDQCQVDQWTSISYTITKTKDEDDLVVLIFDAAEPFTEFELKNFVVI